MQEVSTTATLVEPAAFAGRSHPIAASIPRHEIEDALRSSEDGIDLWIDVSERHADPVRMNVSVTPDDLEKLLRASGSGDDVRVAFDGDQLAEALDPDFEAHGLRETALVLTAAVAAATATAAAADARPIDAGGGGGSAAIAAPLGGAVGAAGEMSPAEALGAAGIVATPSGAVAAAGAESPAEATGGAGTSAASTEPGGAVAASGRESPAQAMGGAGLGVDTAPGGAVAASGGESPAAATGGAGLVVTQSPAGAVLAAGGQSPAEMTGGAALGTPVTASDEGSSFSIPDPGPEALVAGGLALLIAGAGVVATRSRRRPAMP